ncbi:hypothetical protein SLEP1_g55865 [Rubroshorea leprosula]|uniref:Uncharacterized protein n=1 Tax=Rubroshorea leprosula TaxID=152421 RepID=A0AAV5MHV8_9ROSI|nr:hypothetical protein SLEP1_g55865 [Rubroshorea leprosula]
MYWNIFSQTYEWDLAIDKIVNDLWNVTTRIKFKHELSELKAKCAKRNFQVKPPDMNPELWVRLVYLWTEDEINMNFDKFKMPTTRKIVFGNSVNPTEKIHLHHFSVDTSHMRKAMNSDEEYLPYGHLLTKFFEKWGIYLSKEQSEEITEDETLIETALKRMKFEKKDGTQVRINNPPEVEGPLGKVLDNIDLLSIQIEAELNSKFAAFEEKNE